MFHACAPGTPRFVNNLTIPPISIEKVSSLELEPYDILDVSNVVVKGIVYLKNHSNNDVDLSLKRRVITNASELIQKESAFFDGTDSAEGFEIINGSMQINIDKAGDLVIETT